MERLRTLRRTREEARHREALRALDAACRGDANVLPPMMEAVEAGATVGDIGAVFREAFGDWQIPRSP
jgi:methylmalonyl-CoA mutase N-terminal domain/subunit